MMKFLVECFVLTATLVACATSHREVNVAGQKASAFKEDYSATFVSTDYTSIVNVGPGFYGHRAFYPGSASFYTRGEQSLMSYPGSAAVVGVPTTSASGASSPAGDATPATKKDVRALGRALVTVTKAVCELKTSQGKKCE